MSDTPDNAATPAEPGVPDATPTEPLELADQQPLEGPAASAETPAEEPAAPRTSHTRTIVTAVAGAVAVALIFLAGIVGFAVGSVTSDRSSDVQLTAERNHGERPGSGQPGMPGEDLDQDGDQRGYGHGRGHGPGEGPEGAMPGVDPDAAMPGTGADGGTAQG